MASSRAVFSSAARRCDKSDPRQKVDVNALQPAAIVAVCVVRAAKSLAVSWVFHGACRHFVHEVYALYTLYAYKISRAVVYECTRLCTSVCWVQMDTVTCE
jgi:hypothetical protein